LGEEKIDTISETNCPINFPEKERMGSSSIRERASVLAIEMLERRYKLIAKAIAKQKLEDEKIRVSSSDVDVCTLR